MPATKTFPRPAYWIYSLLDRMPLLRRSFNAKVLSVAFLGTHMPLLGILAYLAATGTLKTGSSQAILLTGLGATAAGFALTAGILHALLRPVAANQHMLQQYRDHRRLLAPPIQPDDEMGDLLRGTARTLRELDAHLQRLASEDAATGALNLRGMRARLREAPAEAAVALVQLRGFGGIEAALGHETAEFVLRSALDRARLMFPAALAFAVPAPGRLGVLLEAHEPAMAERLQELLHGLAQPTSVRDRELRLHSAAGLARRQPGQPPQRVLAAAEVALLAALEESGDSVVDAAVGGESFLARLELSSDLDRALARGELVALFQPRVDARTGRVRSLEALARWRHPRRGLLEPSAFLDLAESNDRIVTLGRIMLEQAAAQASAWRDRDVTVSVNVAARQLQNGTLFEDVRQALQRHSLAPAALELELTESSLLFDLEDTRRQLQALRELGVELALDDFGTGYSSLSYLGSIPLDRLKLDWSFVRDLHRPRIELLVRSVVELAHRLELRVTAEGVESPAQAELLRQIGCDQLQGFLFGAPSLPEQIDWRGVRPR